MLSWKMNSLELLIHNTVLNDFIVEMSFSKRKDIIRIIKNYEDIINIHLIKLLTFKDPDNFTKHLKDIDTWIQRIQRDDFNKKGNKLKKSEYFKYLFEEPFTDTDNIRFITLTIKRRLKDYTSLQRTRLSDKEILTYIYLIHQKTSELISQNNLNDFRTDVWNKIVPSF